MSVVVVGVDGSPGSIAALRFALEEARLRQGTLRIVNAWSKKALLGFLAEKRPTA